MPKIPRRPRLALALAIVSAAVAFYAGGEEVGHPMRWVHVAGLFAAGAASGAAIARAKADLRAARERAALPAG